MNMPTTPDDDDWLEPTQPIARERLGPPPGTLVGGVYRVIEPLGSGAMGVVVLAHDESLDRRVAIKFIHPELLRPTFRERFVAEARAMARVNHPNILQVFAFGEHEGEPYIVMEFVRGRTAEEWLARNPGPPPLDVALKILDDACKGIAAIHAADTVHRDIKPGNILLDDDLRVRVADLGLAVLCRHESADAGEVVGTPAYMAPEVAFPSGELAPELRARADVYSLACVAYELLTRRTPFDATNDMAMMLQHAMEPVVPPSVHCPTIPPEVDDAILRALAKAPEVRTPTIEAFRRDLDAARRKSREPTRILVAEDDDAFREALEIALTFEFPDAEIECVADGQAALEAFDRRRPSVAIIDLRMPHLDGLELTGLMRARDASSVMPIIVLTASGGPEEWKRLSAMGADRLLVKPVVLDDVMMLVRRSLGERSSGAPSDRAGDTARPPTAQLFT